MPQAVQVRLARLLPSHVRLIPRCLFLYTPSSVPYIASSALTTANYTWQQQNTIQAAYHLRGRPYHNNPPTSGCPRLPARNEPRRTPTSNLVLHHNLKIHTHHPHQAHRLHTSNSARVLLNHLYTSRRRRILSTSVPVPPRVADQPRRSTRLRLTLKMHTNHRDSWRNHNISSQQRSRNPMRTTIPSPCIKTVDNNYSLTPRNGSHHTTAPLIRATHQIPNDTADGTRNTIPVRDLDLGHATIVRDAQARRRGQRTQMDSSVLQAAA